MIVFIVYGLVCRSCTQEHECNNNDLTFFYRSGVVLLRYKEKGLLLSKSLYKSLLQAKKQS